MIRMYITLYGVATESPNADLFVSEVDSRSNKLVRFSIFVIILREFSNIIYSVLNFVNYKVENGVHCTIQKYFHVKYLIRKLLFCS